MSALVPTMTDFTALMNRVSVLESVATLPGVQASRIADLMQIFGFNTFSSMSATSNVWGSYPADYSPASMAAAMAWLTKITVRPARATSPILPRHLL